MANKINNVPPKRPETEEPTIIDDQTNPQSAEDKKIDRIADRAANKASRTEQRYDEDHNTFSI